MLYLKRYSANENQTQGSLTAIVNNKPVFFCYSLELPWLNNTKDISCIPLGVYIVRKHISPKFKYCFKLFDVPGRSDILIHAGSFNYNTLGCILVGGDWAYLNNDILPDLINSRDTLKNLLDIMPSEFSIVIE